MIKPNNMFKLHGVLRKIVLMSAFLFYTGIIQAQDEVKKPIINFTGLHRGYVTNNLLKGNVTDKDTVSARRGTVGYFLLDLGINVEPSEELKVTSILRTSNTFGAFFGQGTFVEVRQMKAEGVLKKKLYYQIGDIDLMYSKYTLFNSYEGYNQFESDIFKTRRSIANYENFYNGNKWRLQGVNTSGSFSFDSKIKKIYFDIFAVRTRGRRAFTNTLAYTFNNADRFMFGGKVGVIQSKYFDLALNYVRTADMVGSTSDSSYALSTDVLTLNPKLTHETEKMLFTLEGEVGSSFYNYRKNLYVKVDSLKKEKEFNGNFFDATISGFYKPMKLKVFASYRQVSAYYFSPGAQTLRINQVNAPALFPSFVDTISGLPINRLQNVFDRTTDISTNLYNQRISGTLMQFSPIWGNATPYGQATPNRKGLTLGAELENKFLDGEVNFDLLSEVQVEGTDALRKYNVLKGGLNFHINELLKWKKNISISAGGRNEATNRAGSAPVDFSVFTYDAGISIEVIKGIELQGGYKVLQAKGSEFSIVRDEFNKITEIPLYTNFSVSQSTLVGGINIKFGANSYFSSNYNLVTVKYPSQKDINHKISQLFISYTFKF